MIVLDITYAFTQESKATKENGISQLSYGEVVEASDGGLVKIRVGAQVDYDESLWDSSESGAVLSISDEDRLDLIDEQDYDEPEYDPLSGLSASNDDCSDEESMEPEVLDE